MLLAGRTAIVTGATAGIGLAIAERLAREGATIILAARDQPRGLALQNRLRDAGAKAWFVATDLRDVASIRAMVHAAIETAGPIDVLVNNAGATRKIGILDITEQEWDWMQSLNIRGLFFCLQEVARHMLDRGRGKIVNISSIGGKAAAGTSNAGYAASKAAVIAVSRVAARELGAYNINVNSICPGPTKTDMLRNHPGAASAQGDFNQQIIAAVAANAALNRINEPADVADVVVFLASALADNITGQSLNVDNGMIWD